MCGPYGFENYVDMTERPLRSITNSVTWMLILAPTYSTKIFIGQTVMTTYVSRPICDPILKEPEGPTKDRSAYWKHFCKVHIITSYHYIIVGDTYKAHNAI